MVLTEEIYVWNKLTIAYCTYGWKPTWNHIISCRSIFMYQFYKNICFVLFIALYKGRVHRPWGTCGSQKTNFSSQCSSSAKWVLETPMWVSDWSVSASTLLSPYHIFLLFVVLGVYLLGFVCLFDYVSVLTETVFVQFTEHDVFPTSMSAWGRRKGRGCDGWDFWLGLAQ